MQYIIDMDISVAYIIESWPTYSNNHITFRIKSYGFLHSHKFRKSGFGGGVCFIYKPYLKTSVIKHNKQYQYFEYHDSMAINDFSSELAAAGIYRKYL